MRLIAMAWWNSLSMDEKIKISPRNPDTLTGREIEIIWHQKERMSRINEIPSKKEA